jgi:hypothetical protein
VISIDRIVTLAVGRFDVVAMAQITRNLEHPGIVPVYGMSADRE